MNKGWCRLSDLAYVGLGFKSLQNQFYYLKDETKSHFKIEDKFLISLLTMKDTNPSKYFQDTQASMFLFSCALQEADLRGTGALRYINTMAGRPASIKKQSGKAQTIRTALELQGTGLWYAPKAKLHMSNIWVRKAFDSNYAPFLYSSRIAFDQRCNYVIPLKENEWELLAAILSSSLFAFAVESCGVASMGAGALELATKKLREIPLADVRILDSIKRNKLLNLAKMAWENESPVDWRIHDTPGSYLQELDEFLLSNFNSSVSIERIYRDITVTCRSRLMLAEDKKKKVKKKLKGDIDSIAESIAEKVRPLLDSRYFPEGFFAENEESISFDFGEHQHLSIRCQPMLNYTSLIVSSGEASNLILIDKMYPRHLADLIVRSLLIGRRKFRVPVNEEIIRIVLIKYKKWFNKIKEMIIQDCTSSAVGTKYEHEVFDVTMNKLKLHPKADSEIFGEFYLKESQN